MSNLKRSTLIILSALSASWAETCLNDKSFRKVINRGDGTEWARSCSWIRFKEVRRVKHCGNDPDVAANCPQACGMCCDNDDSYMFFNDARNLVECEWITKNVKKAQARIAKYCPRIDNFENDVNIRDACPKACGFCFDAVTASPTVSAFPSISSHPTISPAPTGIPSPTPTNVPTKTPSMSPTSEPSTFPSSSPTDTPTQIPTKYCRDDPSYIFNMDWNSFPVNCDWLSYANPEKRQNQYCPRAEIKSACRETCNFCDCVDDPKYRFKLLTSGNQKGCAWIAKHKKHVGLRRARYCYDVDVTKNTGSDIADACPLSCGFCSPRP